ncbi:MAG TPA: hypothetical protein ENI51_04270, partial [Candidatus Atribacteria bacterium]|nr:hypothetical protein [Candidatus Atribacteria bacterium]
MSNYERAVKFLKKNENHILPLVLFIGIFSFVSFYTLSANIHGDSKMHILFAKEIVKHGNLLQYSPYEVFMRSDGELTNIPIYYPLTTHTTIALFYMIGGEEVLKFFSPFFAALTALFIYFLLKHINKYGAFFVAIFAIVLNSPRFMMTPLLEQSLLFAMVASLYYYYTFLRKLNKKYLLLAGLFLGVTLAIKQQGLYFFTIIFIHCISVGIYKKIKKNETKLLKQFVLMIVITSVVCSGPLIDQMQRNGVLIQLNYKFNIPPFLESQFPADLEAVRELHEIKGYSIDYKTLLEIFPVYLLHPFYYNHSVEILKQHDILQFLGYLLINSFLFTIGLIFIYRNDKMLSFLLIIIFITTMFVTYITDTFPIQYNNIGVAILSICLLFGLFGMKNVIRNLKIRKIVVSLIILISVITIVNSYVTEVHEPLWKNPGRYDDYYLNAYKKMGEYVQNNTPKDAIFLTGGGIGTAFCYYSERRSLWITEFGNAKVPLIFKTKNEEEALHWLEYYNISYIFIDMRQTTCRGVNDYIPLQGLLDYVDSSSHFK